MKANTVASVTVSLSEDDMEKLLEDGVVSDGNVTIEYYGAERA